MLGLFGNAFAFVLLLLHNVSLTSTSDLFIGNQPCYATTSPGGDGTPGFCEHKACCKDNDFVDNPSLCPNYPEEITCCYSENQCGSECEGSCPLENQALACQILELYENEELWLKPFEFSSEGNNPYDGAAPLSNIRDTCYGRKSKRSSYGNAPGGCVCLSIPLLQTMYDYARNFYQKYGLPLEINTISGASHSVNSWHYEGNTMDVACTTPFWHCDQMLEFCLAQDPVETCYPGSNCGLHETWIHCALPLD